MNEVDAIDLIQSAIWMVVVGAGPCVGAAMVVGVAIALFIARRIQAGLAANISPSITNRMPTPMRKSANAMDLIGLEPPI